MEISTPSDVPRSAPAVSAPPAGATPRVVFEREGPLRTTGWLSLEQEDGRVGLRRWLDVGNEPQRRAFLQTLTSQSAWPAPEELGTRLTRLSVYLEEHPEAAERPGDSTVGGQAGASSLTVQAAGWRTLDNGRLMMSPRDFVGDAGASGRIVGAQMPPGANRPAKTLVLPVRGLNIPFADVTLEEGDTVVVEPPREQAVAVIGLVRQPGNMPYPAGSQYTLIQAIAFAGGLDLTADPRFVSVYRLMPEGDVASATFRLVNPRRQQQLTNALALPLKPGDVVSVEHMSRTRTNAFLDKVFRINLGLYVDPGRYWDDD